MILVVMHHPARPGPVASASAGGLGTVHRREFRDVSPSEFALASASLRNPARKHACASISSAMACWLFRCGVRPQALGPVNSPIVLWPGLLSVTDVQNVLILLLVDGSEVTTYVRTVRVRSSEDWRNSSASRKDRSRSSLARSTCFRSGRKIAKVRARSTTRPADSSRLPRIRQVCFGES